VVQLYEVVTDLSLKKLSLTTNKRSQTENIYSCKD